jgi:hypothetical protein
MHNQSSFRILKTFRCERAKKYTHVNAPLSTRISLLFPRQEFSSDDKENFPSSPFFFPTTAAASEKQLVYIAILIHFHTVKGGKPWSIYPK